MQTKPKILVTSASGKTGIPTSLQLLEKGYPVRAFVRKVDHRSELLKKAGAEIFVGDLYSHHDMASAMQDIQRAYACAPTQMNGLHFGAVFAVAAMEAKIEHVVTLGQWLSHPDHPSQLTREAWLNEQFINMLSGISHTVNNVGWFGENYVMGVLPLVQLGMMAMPLGEGDFLGNAPPSNEDIAAVNVAALTQPDLHSGKTYRPTGSKLLSANQMATIAGTVIGRKVTYTDMSEPMFVKAMMAGGFPLSMISQLVLYCTEYRKGTFAIHSPNNVVETVAGKKPDDFSLIVSRALEKNPLAKRNLANFCKALGQVSKIPFIRTRNLEQYKRDQNQVLIANSVFSQESAYWRSNHDPKAGFIPDSPLSGHNRMAEG